MAGEKAKRVCLELECRVDIAHRGVRALRCEPCAARVQREQTRASTKALEAANRPADGKRRKPIQPGARFGTLELVEKGRRGRNSWGLWACECGSVVWRSLSSVVNRGKHDCGDVESHPHHSRKGEQIGYAASHWRVRAARGRAGERDCAGPSCLSSAAEWALDVRACLELRLPLLVAGEDDTYSPGSLHSPDRQGRGYVALCREHHEAQERRQRDLYRATRDAILAQKGRDLDVELEELTTGELATA